MRLLARSIARPRTALRHAGIATASGRRHLTNNGFFRVSEEVREALNSKKPVVALETTIYTHGMSYMSYM
jgi:pseudouridine-5'-phosphate glycosidase/pseudouridine kinase